MQLTSLDHWLREKWVYETHIRTLRPPPSLPRGIKYIEEPDAPGKRYKYLYVAPSTRSSDALIQLLKEEGQMYTTQVVDRKHWLVPIIAPKDKSVTWRLVTGVCITCSIVSGLIYLRRFLEDPVFMKQLGEAINLIKNG